MRAGWGKPPVPCLPTVCGLAIYLPPKRPNEASDKDSRAGCGPSAGGAVTATRVPGAAVRALSLRRSNAGAGPRQVLQDGAVERRRGSSACCLPVLGELGSVWTQ
ncbi:unnamed protein product [Lota lota]